MEKQNKNLTQEDELKNKLKSYSKNIEKLIQLLENKFNDKILFHFYVHSNEGFEFSIDKKFVATNSINNEIKLVYNNSHNYILLRFFCNVKTLFNLNSNSEFCKKLNSKYQSPVFFMTP